MSKQSDIEASLREKLPTSLLGLAEPLSQILGDLHSRCISVKESQERLSTKIKPFLEDLDENIEFGNSSQIELDVFGDKIIVGNISDSDSIAIGREANVQKAQGYNIIQVAKGGIALVIQLNKNGEFHQRSPFTAPNIPDHCIHRSKEYEDIVSHLLQRESGSVSTQTAICGAGGFGKTTLAIEVCHDQRIRETFVDGIFWVVLGNDRHRNILQKASGLYRQLTGKDIVFVDLNDASNGIREALGDRKCLLVIDDLWKYEDLIPFIHDKSRCTYLITTRNVNELPINVQKVTIDRMKPEESVALLRTHLPQDSEAHLFDDLAKKLCHYPLLLTLVNRQIIQSIRNWNYDLSGAINFVTRRLEVHGLTDFDDRDPVERNRAFESTIKASFDLLTQEEILRYKELSVFPEDIDVPFSAISKLWWTTGGLADIDAETLITRLASLSLIQIFDAKRGTIRLHDVFRAYIQKTYPGNISDLHEIFLQSYVTAIMRNESKEDQIDWSLLPSNEVYIWLFLSYHLINAGKRSRLRSLLFDYSWVYRKLINTTTDALIADYDLFEDDAPCIQVRKAIRLSNHVLVQDKDLLYGQLIGRLRHIKFPEVESLIRQAESFHTFPVLIPATSSLNPPNTPLELTINAHSKYIVAVSAANDGNYLATASTDQTVKLWDRRGGIEIHKFTGHRSAVNTVTFTKDGRWLLSGGGDDLIRIWDVSSREEIFSLRGHRDSILSLAVDPNGRYVVSGSRDSTVRIWDLQERRELNALYGHAGWVRAVAISDDGSCFITASGDYTLKLWNLPEGNELQTFSGHTGIVTCVAFLDDNKHIVSGSYDHTVKVWELNSGVPILEMTGHRGKVRCVASIPNRGYIVSGGNDLTLRIWESTTGVEVAVLRGHAGYVRGVCVLPGSQ
ncbi:MAG: NB-ARC domain-containing protein, partial [Anaerolinea sp.]